MTENDDVAAAQAEARDRLRRYTEMERRTPYSSSAERERARAIVSAMRGALDQVNTGAASDVSEQAFAMILAEELHVRETQLREPVDWQACECDGSGFAAIRPDPTDQGKPRVRPCRRCNEDAYVRWIEGHYAADHGPGCDECQALSRSRARRPSRAATGVVT